MKRFVTIAVAAILCLALAAPAAAADPWRPFKGGGTTVDTMAGPEGVARPAPDGATRAPARSPSPISAACGSR